MSEIKLPKKFEEFAEARKQGFLKVKAVKEKGGKVAGIFCTYTPLEILDAAGFITASLCGMSAETIPDAEIDLPKNMCPLIKSSYGFAVADKCPYTYFSDLIVGETTCDGKKKMYELLGKIKNVYILHLPQSQDRDALDVWTREIRRFIQYLEDTFELTITDEALREAAHKRNIERHTKLELMELQKNDPPMAKGYDIYKTLDGAGFIFDADERIKKVNALKEEIIKANKDGNSDIDKKTKRIIITGCPIGGVLDKTVKAIESCGGTVVCFENCSGIKANQYMIDENADDIVEAIAMRYLNIGCAVMTPDNNRKKLLKELIEEYHADGVVEVDLWACTPYLSESTQIRQEMKEIGIPYQMIETDYSTSDEGQIATRMEAFIEQL